MTERSPFKPHYGTNQVVTPGAASANIPIAAGDKTVRVVNTGANVAYFRISTATAAQAATTADCPVASGSFVMVEKEQDWTNFAHISPVGSTLQVMTGEGGY